jgi:plasmid maintenance system killer protein
MVESFGNALAEDIFYDRKSKSTRSFPNELQRTARRKLLYLHDATDLKGISFNTDQRSMAIGFPLEWRAATRSADIGLP